MQINKKDVELDAAMAQMTASLRDLDERTRYLDPKPELESLFREAGGPWSGKDPECRAKNPQNLMVVQLYLQQPEETSNISVLQGAARHEHSTQ